MEIIKIKKLSEKAVVPVRATEGSAGMDLCACMDESITLKGGETALIPTGIAAEIPKGFGLFIFPRSGLSIKHGIGLLNSVGVVDRSNKSDFRKLYNRAGGENSPDGSDACISVRYSCR